MSRALLHRDGPTLPAVSAVAVALLLAVLAPAGAAASEGFLRFSAAAGEARLELPAGGVVSLALPPGAKLAAAAVLAGGWIAAGTVPDAAGGGNELLLLAGVAHGEGAAAPAATFATLTPPAGRSGRLLAEPLPLVDDGRLAGLVWLEGDDSRALGVRYAAWSGRAWSAPQTISAPGQGSQLALAAARLAGGSWLLTWSAFDGHDDEIVWSWGRNGSWTQPRRLTDNRVPDITPAVAAAGRGALIAWSQLAGDGYRLLVARFLDGSFGEPEVVAPGGSLYPSFEAAPGAGRYRLLYRTAQPRGWAALELDAAGRPQRQAETGDPPAAGPAGGAAVGALARPALLAGASPARAQGAAAAAAPAATGPAASVAGVGGDRATFSWHSAAAAAWELTAPWRPWQPPAPAPTRGGQRGERRQAAPTDATVTTYAAFGDSITSGFGDPKGIGYPGRLEGLLSTSSMPVTVINDGFFGETTGEGLTRIGSVLQPGVNVVLLMEGTNDISAKVSVDTIVQNLDLMADQAEAVGVAAVHVTVIPRLPTADTDPTNLITGTLAGAVRDLAWRKSRTLVDPFEVFFYLTPNALTQDYVGGVDRLHPNAAGYDLLARTFADVLTGADKVPPVTGLISPFNGQQNVPVNAQIQVDLYDLGAGIDVANTHLLLDGQAVAVTPAGGPRKLELRYQPTTPLAGVVSIGLDTRDLANPPNTFTGTIAKFEVVGTVFLAGDLNQDGIVDGQDLILFAYCFGAHRFDPNFRLYCDFNGDGIVDGRDLAVLASNFGKRSF
jgi:acyl-CoA thioesterase-1